MIWVLKKLLGAIQLEATANLKKNSSMFRSKMIQGLAISSTLDTHLNCLGVNKRSRMLLPLVEEETLLNKSN